MTNICGSKSSHGKPDPKQFSGEFNSNQWYFFICGSVSREGGRGEGRGSIIHGATSTSLK